MKTSSPLVIGGTGGSGTRLVAQIARLAGRYMGDDRSEAEDSRLFAGFDWKWGLRYLQSGSSAAMEQEFEEVLASHLENRPDGLSWGWKCPHSYLLIPFLRSQFPRMKFIHVIRDGRDMAFSENQMQALHYGSRLLPHPNEPQAVGSAAWWSWANLRARDASKALGADYLLVRLEDLCANRDSAAKVLEFCGHENVNHDLPATAALVTRPDSLGRWRSRDPILVRRVEAACSPALWDFGYL